MRFNIITHDEEIFFISISNPKIYLKIEKYINSKIQTVIKTIIKDENIALNRFLPSFVLLNLSLRDILHSIIFK